MKDLPSVFAGSKMEASMGKPRLGRAERQIVRAYHRDRLAKKAAIVAANLSQPKPEPVKYASIFGQLSGYAARAKVGQRRLYATPKDRVR